MRKALWSLTLAPACAIIFASCSGTSGGTSLPAEQTGPSAIATVRGGPASSLVQTLAGPGVPIDIPDAARELVTRPAHVIAAAAGKATITEYPLPNALADPIGIVAGPDGALWFTESGIGKIGRITTNGSVSEYSLPNAKAGPFGITVGPDKNIWFAEELGGAIGQITTGGTITEYSVPGAAPTAITRSPNNELWYLGFNGSQPVVGTMTTKGKPGSFNGGFPIGGRCTGTANSLTIGPGHMAWFAEGCTYGIGQLSSSGTYNTFAVTANSGGFMPVSAVAGRAASNAPIAFTELYPNEVGFLSAGGKLLKTYSTGNLTPWTIVRGRNNVFWFGGNDNNPRNIGRITAQGHKILFALPTPASQIVGMTVGPDNAIWFTDSFNGIIGKITIPN